MLWLNLKLESFLKAFAVALVKAVAVVLDKAIAGTTVETINRPIVEAVAPMTVVESVGKSACAAVEQMTIPAATVVESVVLRTIVIIDCPSAAATVVEPVGGTIIAITGATFVKTPTTATAAAVVAKAVDR